MSCKDEFFKKEEQDIRETWLKPLVDHEDGYEMFDWCFYDASPDAVKHTYSKDQHHLELRCEDDTNHTYKKTWYALNAVEKLFGDYDYVFRTNTSTYVNLKLLSRFVETLDDDTTLWASELYSLSNSFCPYPLYLYGRGNGLLMPKKVVSLLLNNGKVALYLDKCDDWMIGNILNSYWMSVGEDYLSHIKSYTHGWYKCVPEDMPTNHKLCTYGNHDKSYEKMGKFITIQVKRYRERELESKHYHELDGAMKLGNPTEEELDSVCKEIHEYSEDPSVFIGSILGYVSYSEWKSCDKMKLFNYQVAHKANDDEEFGKNSVWL